jgi:hypothetical protein
MGKIGLSIFAVIKALVTPNAQALEARIRAFQALLISVLFASLFTP